MLVVAMVPSACLWLKAYGAQATMVDINNRALDLSPAKCSKKQ